MLEGTQEYVGNGGLAERADFRRRGEQTSLADLLVLDPPDQTTAEPAVPHLRALEAVNEGYCSRVGKRRDAFFRRSLAIADVIGVVSALFLTQALVGQGWFPLHVYLAVPLVVAVAKLNGLYDRDELVIGKTTLSETPAIFQLATLCSLLVALATGGETPLLVEGTLLLWGLLFVGMLAARNVARRLVRAVTPPERCLVIGSEQQALRLDRKLRCHASAHAETTAYLPFESFELRRNRPGDFWRFVAGRGIDRAIVGHCESRDRVLETVRYFKEHDVKVSVLPDLLEIVGSSVEFDEIHGTTLLGVRSFGLSRSSGFLKRSLDVAGSVVLMLALAPFMLAVALAIKADSRGPVLFRQTRVGRDGRKFTLLKFRTMFDGTDQMRDELAAFNQTEGLFKLADDPRITRVGGYLRRTSLDELPQLLNVLRGEMSLVGPRPLVVSEDAKVEGWHRRRLHLKPGMTGAWQIMGQTRVPLREMVSMDYLYIVNWSAWADVRIVLQTVGHVLRRRGL